MFLSKVMLFLRGIRGHESDNFSLHTHSRHGHGYCDVTGILLILNEDFVVKMKSDIPFNLCIVSRVKHENGRERETRWAMYLPLPVFDDFRGFRWLAMVNHCSFRSSTRTQVGHKHGTNYFQWKNSTSLVLQSSSHWTLYQNVYVLFHVFRLMTFPFSTFW